MSWRVALIDSCGSFPGAVDAAAFALDGGMLGRTATADPSGHGSRIARLLSSDGPGCALLLGQVFLDAGPTSGSAVAAALDWAVARGARLIHMSLGLAADRAVLAAAVARAADAGCVLVASTPARGAAVYPATYPGVLRATGDARCAPGELSALGPRLFGGCPRLALADIGQSGFGRGASIGAAWVSRAILEERVDATAAAVASALTARARHLGRERKRRSTAT